MFEDISIEELRKLQNEKGIVLVDVRSPSEYADGTIPGSMNIPLFDDQERSEVGTLYKQTSAEAAKEKGLEIVSGKLPAFVRSFSQIPGKKAVFCWRGGMRSKTTATVLGLMGIRVYRVFGGIRAYRKWVVDALEHFDLKPECVVINGYTGSGKTILLQNLQAEGYPVLDLEKLAGHRGSIFGHIGLEPNNQKTFEALLVEELLQLNESKYVLLEAESQRIGKAVMPSFLVEAKQRGKLIFLDIPMKERVKHIIEDYDPNHHKEKCIEAFSRIKKHIHTPIAKDINDLLLSDRFPDAVELMLLHYYDQKYEHGLDQYGTDYTTIQADNIDEATLQVKEQIKCWYE